jgi:hypothetical protein
VEEDVEKDTKKLKKDNSQSLHIKLIRESQGGRLQHRKFKLAAVIMFGEHIYPNAS